MTRLVTAVVLSFLATIAIVVLAFVGIARAGTVNVAATADYAPGAEWFLSTLSEQSIRRQARRAVEAGEITPPGEVTPAMLRNGTSHYQSMCVVCHGAPGVPRGEIGEGLKPEPPELSHVARERSEAEIFWVLQNGIRHTGMPAFGATHSEEDLWALAAFVERLDGMSPDHYRRVAGESGSAHMGGHDHGQGHHHGEGGEVPSGHADSGPTDSGQTDHDHPEHDH